jgi:DNA polymerase-3 subunit delta'
VICLGFGICNLEFKLIGHQRIWNFLTQSTKNGRLAHAYLFVGASQVGKRTLALNFAKWLLCQEKKKGLPCDKCRSCLDIKKNQNPDVFFLTPRQEEKKGVVKTHEIGIDEIKALQHQLSLFTFSAFLKIAIIDSIEFLTHEAANSFLKTLEEPRKKTLIILISSNWQAILPTIISRCQLIKFLSVSDKEIIEGISPLVKTGIDFEKIARFSANRPGRAIELINQPEILEQRQKNKESFKRIQKADLFWRWELVKQLSQDVGLSQRFLSQWSLWLRDRILQNQNLNKLVIEQEAFDKNYLSQTALANLIKEIQRTQAILGNSSSNSRLALESLMMKI